MSHNLQLAIAAPRARACGIGDYAGFLAAALGPDINLFCVELPSGSSSHVWKQAATQAESADVAHVLFEPSLFSIPRPYVNRFATFMKRLKPPAVVTLHDILPQLRPRWSENQPHVLADLLRDLAYLPFFLPWERIQYKRAEHWLVHSPDLESRVSKLAGHERVSLALHPVPPAGRTWSADEEHPFDLISPGFVKAHKGYLGLLDLLPSLPNLSWVLAGGPQDKYDRFFTDRFKTRIEQLGLSDRVKLTGYLPRSDLEDLATRSKAAIFPFKWAAGSGSLTWAIALGLPILATDLPALVQFKKAGAGIKLLPLDNSNSGGWHELIESVLRNPAAQSSLSEANLNFARRHSYAALAQLVKPIYQRLAHTGKTL